MKCYSGPDCAPPLSQLFHSVLDGYGSVGSACLALLSAGGRGLLPWRPTETSLSVLPLAFHASLAALRLLSLWLVACVLLRNYRRARAELHRPAAHLQGYEMVELFLRRLKMWMGLSRAKEVPTPRGEAEVREGGRGWGCSAACVC